MTGRDYVDHLSRLVSKWAGGRAWNLVENPELEAKILVKHPARSTDGRDISMIDVDASIKRLQGMLLKQRDLLSPVEYRIAAGVGVDYPEMKFNISDTTSIILSETKDPVLRAQKYDMLKRMTTINADGETVPKFPRLAKGSPWVIEPFLGGRFDQFFPHMDMPEKVFGTISNANCRE
jgi:hypothetical protein